MNPFYFIPQDNVLDVLLQTFTFLAYFDGLWICHVVMDVRVIRLMTSTSAV